MARLTYLDSVRGIAILLILWLHLGMQTYLPLQILEPSIRFSSFALPLFFVLSGYFFAGSLNKAVSPKKVILGKIRSTLVPFYALSLLFVPLVFINQYLTPTHYKTWKSALKALLTFDISENLPSGVLWFLFVLFLFFVFTLAVTRLIKNKTAAKFILLALSFALLLAFPWLAHIDFMGVSRISRAFFFFIFGFYLLEHIISLKNSAIYPVVACLAAVALFYIHFYRLPAGTYVCFAVEMMACLTTHIAIILTVKFLEDKARILFSPLRFFGIHSMSIFVFHVPAYTLCSAIFKKIGILNYLGVDILIIVVCGAIPLIIEYLLCYVPPLCWLLLGRAPIFKTSKITS